MEYRRFTVARALPCKAMRNLSLKGLIKNKLSSKLIKYVIKSIRRVPILVYKSNC